MNPSTQAPPPAVSMNPGPAAARPDGGVDPRAPLPGLLRLFFRSFRRDYAQCRDARFVLADVPVDRAAARRVLPFWMRPTGTATVFVVDYRHPTFTDPYREAAVMLHVRTPWGRGRHCCWMVLDDDDTAMIYGRETLAYPKKRARIYWEEEDGRVRAAVVRRGVEVLAIEAALGEPEPDPDPVFDVKTFNLGGIGQLLAFTSGWCFRIAERFRSSHAAEAVVALAPSVDDPVAVLVSGARHRVRGRFASTDVFGLRYLFPAGIAGPRWFANTYFMRFR